MRMTRYKKSCMRRLRNLRIVYSFFIFVPLISIVMGWIIAYHFIEPTLKRIEDMDKKLKKYEVPVFSMYSIELGVFEDKEATIKQIVFLRNKKIYTYTLDERPYRILGGIFVTKDRAQNVIEFLKKKGVSAEIREEKRIKKFLEISSEYEKDAKKVLELFDKLNESILSQEDILIKLYVGKSDRDYFDKNVVILTDKIKTNLKEIDNMGSNSEFRFLPNLKSLFELQLTSLQKDGDDLNALIDGYIQVLIKYREFFEQLN